MFFSVTKVLPTHSLPDRTETPHAYSLENGARYESFWTQNVANNRTLTIHRNLGLCLSLNLEGQPGQFRSKAEIANLQFTYME
jgi:hypothetical protein